jgi:hypothetical protein
VRKKRQQGVFRGLTKMLPDIRIPLPDHSDLTDDWEQ